MNEALIEARKAYEKGEVPVGAIITKKGRIIARGHNLKEYLKDPTAHAEIICIRDAAHKLGEWRLTECELYVTIEPCCMCAGAIIQARIQRLIIGAMDPKAGAVGSLLNVVEDERFNHRVIVRRGVLKEESSSLMKDFFRHLRYKGERWPSLAEGARLESE